MHIGNFYGFPYLIWISLLFFCWLSIIMNKKSETYCKYEIIKLVTDANNSDMNLVMLFTVFQ